MVSPIEIHADFKANAYEITYRHLDEAVVERDERVAPGVTAGVDAAGNVVAIELLTLERDALAAAREFAKANGLRFPRDLAGLIAAA